MWCHQRLAFRPWAFSLLVHTKQCNASWLVGWKRFCSRTGIGKEVNNSCDKNFHVGLVSGRIGATGSPREAAKPYIHELTRGSASLPPSTSPRLWQFKGHAKLRHPHVRRLRLALQLQSISLDCVASVQALLVNDTTQHDTIQRDTRLRARRRAQPRSGSRPSIISDWTRRTTYLTASEADRPQLDVTRLMRGLDA